MPDMLLTMHIHIPLRMAQLLVATRHTIVAIIMIIIMCRLIC